MLASRKFQLTPEKFSYRLLLIMMIIYIDYIYRYITFVQNIFPITYLSTDKLFHQQIYTFKFPFQCTFEFLSIKHSIN